ncbi:hypothetical protein [Microcoleus sp. PH2017_28_MFU_U_A]|jgi:hypothetical protein|uniref:hypothetical protein n=1 Tax=Microcoleus sp. PH2017_28_MFU_U_A TaxID=2798838 RepID=UPI002D8042B7|nr:hypothetical protein [Microcoleus sp. PH2017_28_MFU_U_A]
MIYEGRRKKEEGRRKKEEGRILWFLSNIVSIRLLAIETVCSADLSPQHQRTKVLTTNLIIPKLR